MALSMNMTKVGAAVGVGTTRVGVVVGVCMSKVGVNDSIEYRCSFL